MKNLSKKRFYSSYNILDYLILFHIILFNPNLLHSGSDVFHITWEKTLKTCSLIAVNISEYYPKCAFF